MRYAFEGFEIDTDRHELRQEGARVDLQPKVLGLLLHLIRNRHRVVARDELFREVWPDVVVSDDALFNALKKARSALGDDGAAQRIIETIPRVGYRFVARIAEIESAGPEPAPEAGSPHAAPDAGSPHAAPLAEAPLIGRGPELASLRRALGAAIGGSGRIVILSGEAGIGKSRLAGEIAQTARERGVAVHEALSWHGSGAPPFWVWVQILRSYVETWRERAPAEVPGDEAREIARLVPDLQERLGLEAPPVRDSDDARFRQMDAIARFLVKASRACPQLLILEDLHWAPPATLQMLAFLAGELASERILVIATCREHETDPEGALEAAIAACAQRDVLVRLPLAGLTAQELTELVRQTVGFLPSADLARALHAKTGGNPFFVKEIVQFAAGESEGGIALEERIETRSGAVPEGVRRVLERRLSLLSEDCRKVIALAAVAGELPLVLLPRVIELPREKLLDALEEARSANLLELVPGPPPVYHFAHALVRETAYAATPEPQRVQLHRKVAVALEALHAGRLGAVVPALAHHYGRAAILLEGMEAVDYAKWAGDLATAALSYEEAVTYYEQGLMALDLHPAEDTVHKRAELLVCAGFARQNAGDNATGRRQLQEAAALAEACGDANLLGYAALGFGELGFGVTDAESVALLEAALAALGDRPGFLYVCVRAGLAIHVSNSPARHAEALRLVAEAEDCAHRLRDPLLLGYALTARASVLRLVESGTPEDRVPLLRKAGPLLAAGGDRTIEMLNWAQLRGALFELGDLDGALAANERIAAILSRLRSELWSYVGIGVRALPALLAGRFPEAESLAGFSFGKVTGQRFSLAMRMAVIGLVRFEQRRLSEILPLLEGIGQELPALPGLRALRVLALLEAGSAAPARLEFEALARSGFRDVVGTESWIFACALLAFACTELGDEAAARDLVAILEPRASTFVICSNGLFCFGPVALHLGNLAVALGDWEGAETYLDAALAGARKVKSPVWEAHALAARARLHAARDGRGDEARARALSREARGLAEPLGMQRLLRQLPVPEEAGAGGAPRAPRLRS